MNKINQGTSKVGATLKPEKPEDLKMFNVFVNKPGTAKAGAISKAQNCKRGDFLGFVKLQFVAKYGKK